MYYQVAKGRYKIDTILPFPLSNVLREHHHGFLHNHSPEIFDTHADKCPHFPRRERIFFFQVHMS